MNEDKDLLWNWNEFLNRKDIPIHLWHTAAKLSGKWTTCAVGSQCDIIPRYDNNKPIDTVLENLGMDFYIAIVDKNVIVAKALLNEIEIRSAYILKQINKN